MAKKEKDKADREKQKTQQEDRKKKAQVKTLSRNRKIFVKNCSGSRLQLSDFAQVEIFL
jgi:hypothetical protein